MSTASPLVHIVLHQPEIPGNTGAVGRTCVALGAKLWLVRPLGFRIDEKTLRRAGLDYWEHLDWEVVDHWEALMERIQAKRLWMLSRFGKKSIFEVAYQRGDVLVFGCETNGLPAGLTTQYSDSLLRIPTTNNVRSLNLSNSVAVCAYELARQMINPTEIDLD